MQLVVPGLRIIYQHLYLKSNFIAPGAQDTKSAYSTQETMAKNKRNEGAISEWRQMDRPRVTLEIAKLSTR